MRGFLSRLTGQIRLVSTVLRQGGLPVELAWMVGEFVVEPFPHNEGGLNHRLARRTNKSVGAFCICLSDHPRSLVWLSDTALATEALEAAGGAGGSGGAGGAGGAGGDVARTADGVSSSSSSSNSNSSSSSSTPRSRDGKARDASAGEEDALVARAGAARSGSSGGKDGAAHRQVGTGRSLSVCHKCQRITAVTVTVPRFQDHAAPGDAAATQEGGVGVREREEGSGGSTGGGGGGGSSSASSRQSVPPTPLEGGAPLALFLALRRGDPRVASRWDSTTFTAASNAFNSTRRTDVSLSVPAGATVASIRAIIEGGDLLEVILAEEKAETEGARRQLEQQKAQEAGGTGGWGGGGGVEGMEFSRGGGKGGKDAAETARQEPSGGEGGGEEATRQPFNILTRTGRVLTRSQEQATRVEEIMDTVHGSQTTIGTSKNRYNVQCSDSHLHGEMKSYT